MGEPSVARTVCLVNDGALDWSWWRVYICWWVRHLPMLYISLERPENIQMYRSSHMAET